MGKDWGGGHLSKNLGVSLWMSGVFQVKRAIGTNALRCYVLHVLHVNEKGIG